MYVLVPRVQVLYAHHIVPRSANSINIFQLFSELIPLVVAMFFVIYIAPWWTWSARQCCALLTTSELEWFTHLLFLQSWTTFPRLFWWGWWEIVKLVCVSYLSACLLLILAFSRATHLLVRSQNQQPKRLPAQHVHKFLQCRQHIYMGWWDKRPSFSDLAWQWTGGGTQCLRHHCQLLSWSCDQGN